jgi:hypothetical protein
MQCSKFGAYSMTSSARASRVGGISRLSALAALALIKARECGGNPSTRHRHFGAQVVNGDVLHYHGAT